MLVALMPSKLDELVVSKVVNALLSCETNLFETDSSQFCIDNVHYTGTDCLKREFDTDEPAEEEHSGSVDIDVGKDSSDEQATGATGEEISEESMSGETGMEATANATAAEDPTASASGEEASVSGSIDQDFGEDKGPSGATGLEEPASKEPAKPKAVAATKKTSSHEKLESDDSSTKSILKKLVEKVDGIEEKLHSVHENVQLLTDQKPAGRLRARKPSPAQSSSVPLVRGDTVHDHDSGMLISTIGSDSSQTGAAEPAAAAAQVKKAPMDAREKVEIVKQTVAKERLLEEKIAKAEATVGVKQVEKEASEEENHGNADAEVETEFKAAEEELQTDVEQKKKTEAKLSSLDALDALSEAVEKDKKLYGGQAMTGTQDSTGGASFTVPAEATGASKPKDKLAELEPANNVTAKAKNVAETEAKPVAKAGVSSASPAAVEQKCVILKNMPSCPLGSFAATFADPSFTEEEYRNGLNSLILTVDAMIGLASPGKLPKGFHVEEAKNLLLEQVCNTMFPKCAKTKSGQCFRQGPCKGGIQNFHSKYLKDLLKPELIKSIFPGGKYEMHLKMLIANPTSVKILQKIVKTVTDANDPVFSQDSHCSAINSPRFSKC
jgi:hypothetical protein